MKEIKITMERCRRGFPAHLLSSPAVSPRCAGAPGPKGLDCTADREPRDSAGPRDDTKFDLCTLKLLLTH